MVMLHQLRPASTDQIDAALAYAYPTTGERHLRVNMVSSVDGAAAVDGRVGTLTGPADQELLLTLRSLCDVLLVGAGTVRAEGYGPVTTLPELRHARRELGQLASPRLAVLSRSISVDLRSAAFTHAVERPLVITTELADPDRVRAAEQVADVVIAGERDVDLRLATGLLVDRGLPRMLSEGGPKVLSELYAAGLVDELCLALSPVVTCGAATRVTAGPALPAPLPQHLAGVLEAEEFLFLRYTRGPVT